MNERCSFGVLRTLLSMMTLSNKNEGTDGTNEEGNKVRMH